MDRFRSYTWPNILLYSREKRFVGKVLPFLSYLETRLLIGKSF